MHKMDITWENFDVVLYDLNFSCFCDKENKDELIEEMFLYCLGFRSS